MALSDLAIKRARPKEEKYLICDEDSLYLCIFPSGKKSWVMRYRVDGKERKKTLGTYPQMPLKEARRQRDEIKGYLQANVDPFASRVGKSRLFDKVALAWWNEHKQTLKNAKNIQTTEHRVKAYIIPAFHGRDCATIKPSEIADFCKRISDTGKVETAHRTLDLLRQIFRSLVESGELTGNPVNELRGTLPRRKQEHHPSITDPHELADFRDRIRNCRCAIPVKCAMLFSLYTFARPGEIRHAEWGEIQGEEWHIPAQKMKAGVKHIVPLSRQALAVLDEMRPFSECYGGYIFPAQTCYDGTRPYSDNTINLAFVRSLGYPKGKVTAHGFRSTASTILNESGLWNWDAIEAQLAHSGGDRVRKAYNYARYIAERRSMMQWYADYIDGLR